MPRLTRAALAPWLQKELIKQQYKCAVCGVPLQVGKKASLNGSYRGLPCADHDHDSGYLRGVLCNTCNTGEGKIRSACIRYGMGKENYIDWLVKMAAYLHTRARTPISPYLHPTHKTEDEKRLAKNAKARKKRQANKSK